MGQELVFAIPASQGHRHTVGSQLAVTGLKVEMKYSGCLSQSLVHLYKINTMLKS